MNADRSKLTYILQLWLHTNLFTFRETTSERFTIYHIRNKMKNKINSYTVLTPCSPSSPSLLVSLAGLKRHLQDFVTQPVPVQAMDGHGSLLIICHGDETKTFTLVGVEISDHLHIDDSTKRPKQLPQHSLVRLLTQVIDEDAPTGRRVPRRTTSTAKVIHTHRRKPGSTRKHS